MFRVFVDAVAVEVEPGSVARDAVAARDPSVLARLEDGTAYLTDGRGIRLDPDTPLAAGAILRLVKSARRGAEADADA
ncbi:MAG TPA: hypothetical protein VJU15_04850 [Gemmatimonadales bacterium]|nr:hypothetical protein [Gemmatimonadales bacterium]